MSKDVETPEKTRDETTTTRTVTYRWNKTQLIDTDDSAARGFYFHSMTLEWINDKFSHALLIDDHCSMRVTDEDIPLPYSRLIDISEQ